MKTVTLKNKEKRVHYTLDYKKFRKNQIKIIKTNTLVILEHNHRITIKMKIIHNHHSHLLAFKRYQNILFTFRSRADGRHVKH